MTNKERDAIRALRQALKPFMDIDGGMTLNRLEALLTIYVYGVEDMQVLRDTVEKQVGLSKSAMSRMVSWWAKEAYLQYKNDQEGNQVVPNRPAGMGFLEIAPDPLDYRRRIIEVTPRGNEFGQKLANGFSDAANSFVEAWLRK